jgi:DNA-binding CsgD family transcriptional regulator
LDEAALMGADSRLRIAGVIGEPHPFSKWVVWLLGVLVSVHDLTDPAEVWRRYRAREVEGADAPEQAGGVVAARASGAPLTAREQAVLRLVAEDLTDAQIAAQLGISEQAVERRLANAFRKLGVHSRAAAVARALRHGWM